MVTVPKCQTTERITYVYFSWAKQPTLGSGRLTVEVSRSHTFTHTDAHAPSRTPTQYTTNTIVSERLEPGIPAVEQSET
jgi:hypothetical protein